MKPILIARAASLALAAAMSSTSVSAQLPTGCRSECDSVPYSTERRTVVHLANGCVARVVWVSRPSCTVGLDLAILSVEPLTDECSSMKIATLVNEATDT
ncbi:MAG: hypothetical protein H7X80_05220, partial [bacterium]|nr:hypothetical protein [Candidatus Kapabacteria bacterium]